MVLINDNNLYQQIVSVPSTRRPHPSKPPGPRGPAAGAAPVKKTIFTQAIGQRAA